MAEIDYAGLIGKLMKIGAKDEGALCDLYDVLVELERVGSVDILTSRGEYERTEYDKDNFRLSHTSSAEARRLVGKMLREGSGTGELEQLYKRLLLFDAPYDFDVYCRYIELNRDIKKRFYLPRRKQLLPIVRQLQRLTDDKLDLLALSCPPGIGKTTLALFYLTFIGGRDPNLSILGGSHSNSFLRGAYEEIGRIVDPKGEYLFADVFPKAVVAKTNAKEMRLDLGKAKRFETFEFSSIGSGNAGKVRASALLYCDDLIEGIETAMSKERLDKLWQQYYTDLRQRKIGDCKELHIATRWSIYDPIGRLQMEYEDNPRAEFVAFPAVDENGESLWDYPYHLGFTTEFYRQQQAIMDDPSWKALYMNEPIEREGQLYAPDELRRYLDGELPDRDPDAIIAVCDIADGGGDYWCLPIAYKYGQDYYIHDWICDNGKPEIVEERIVNKLLEHKVQIARFESNRAGGRVAESVQKRIKEKGGITKITTKWNQTDKITRIYVASSYAKEHFLFKNENLYTKEYKTAMTMLCGYTMTGRNKHDDVPDALAQLVDFIDSADNGTVTVMKRPF